MDRSQCYQLLSTALVDQALLNEQDIAKLERLAGNDPSLRMPQLLLDLGMLSQIDLADQLASVSNTPRVTAKDLPIEPVLDGVSSRFLKNSSIAGLFVDEQRVGIAVVDPFDREITDALALALDKQIQVHVGVRSEIEKAVSQQTEQTLKQPNSLEPSNDDDDIEHLRDIASEAPVIRYVNVLFQRAVEARASDIHIESADKSLKIRLRVDGVLQDFDAPPSSITMGVISRIKLLAKLNIAERRLPQDGRIRYQINGKEFDMRISTTPTIHGEGLVIRLLDRAQVKLDFNTLGFEGQVLNDLLSVLSRPNGVLLITGPTGSGKTTTLYAALTQLNTAQTKIITVEDPVEYELAGINQIQVKPDIGLEFPTVLRSIVRQDPDIIMIGEMRDVETANIAIQSALTGHLVLSTLHTNDAASAVIRLLDMGVDDFLLASTVNGILAQRLARKLCDSCKTSYQPSPALINELSLQALVDTGKTRFHSAVGCEHCGKTGYKGRLAIVELLIVTEPLKRLIMSNANASELATEAIKNGMQTMLLDGITKAARGLTTLEEVVRLTKGN